MNGFTMLLRGPSIEARRIYQLHRKRAELARELRVTLGPLPLAEDASSLVYLGWRAVAELERDNPLVDTDE